MVIDITRRIHAGMAIYPGNPGVTIRQIQKAGDGVSALSEISLGSHTGTHIDAPSHIVEGAAGVDGYDLELMMGPAEVVDLSRVESVIGAADLVATTTSRVLIKTKNSTADPDIFTPDFVALDESAAKELVRRGVKLIGIDGWSIKKKGVKDKVHQILLDAGVVIVEGLWLKDVKGGEYELLCLPLSLGNIDGAPVRAVLRC
jgi:arylformamidase